VARPTREHFPSPESSASAGRQFDARWQEWLAREMLRGVPEERLVVSLQRHGFEDSLIRRHMALIRASPTFQAALHLLGQSHKLATLVDALSEQFRQSPSSYRVPVEESIDPRSFFDRYYFGNRPVVARGLMRSWPALKRWGPRFFAEQFGDREVEISHHRDADPRYEDNFSRHRLRLPMTEYVELVARSGVSNDAYLVAKNNLLEQEDFQALFEDFDCPAGFLDPHTLRRRVSLWFGPAGTVTPLHHDLTNIFFAQVYGRKRVRLIPPYDMERVYNDRQCFSEVDLDNVDFERFPLMRQVSVLDVTVRPGDFLLIPLGWWHWVRSLDVSISLSFQNFALPTPAVQWRWP
jgi:ribosomal protein L16 Arg81 hydroxylase